MPSLVHIITGKKNIARQLSLINPLHSALPQPDTLSYMQTAIGAVVTKVPDAGDLIPNVMSQGSQLIENLFPKNVSLGLEMFCIWIANKETCAHLPFTISNFISPSVVKIVGKAFKDIEKLEKVLGSATIVWIRNPFIVGVIWTFIDTFIILFAFLSAFKLPLWLEKVAAFLKMPIISISLGILLCITFIIPFVCLIVLKTKIGQLPMWIQLQDGSLYVRSAIAMFLAIISASAAIFFTIKFRNKLNLQV